MELYRSIYYFPALLDKISFGKLLKEIIAVDSRAALTLLRVYTWSTF